MDNLEKLIVDLKESLERELGGLRHDVQQVRQEIVQLNARFDTQAARLERHAGLWQTGARWSSRMDAWAEKIDVSLEPKDREIAELRERLQRLKREPE